MNINIRTILEYDENMRYENLFMDVSGKYTSIRDNPDKFINTKLQKIHASKKDRICEKINVEKHIQRIEHGLNTDFIEIHRLFYNEN